MSNVVRNVIMIIVFFVCLALIFVGQKNISATGLCMELAGLAGLLVLLFIYTRRYKSRRNVRLKGEQCEITD